MPQQTINDILDSIDKASENFLKTLPNIEKEQYKRIVQLLKSLDTTAGNRIKSNIKNINIINRIRTELNDIVKSDPYIKAVKDFATVFDDISVLQNTYFSTISDKFTPSKTLNAVKQYYKKETIRMLLETNTVEMGNNIAAVLRENITGGGSYFDLTDVMKGLVQGTTEEASIGKRLFEKNVIDAVHQYNRQYTKAVTDDLGLEWYQYVGSLLKTSREFCVKMCKQRHFHKSEVPDILKGQLANGVTVALNPNNDLPKGMYDNEDENNFFIYAGGHKCGHGIFPVSTASVPKVVRDRVTGL